MNEREQKRFEAWKQTKAKGMKKYVLGTGLGFSLLLFLVNLFTTYFVGDKIQFTVGKIIWLLLLSLVFGLLYAVIMWYYLNYYHDKKIKK